MWKIFFALILTVCVATTAFAVGPLQWDVNYKAAMQGVAYDPAMSRTIPLYTKGFGCISSAKRAAIHYTARVTNTDQLAYVKLFLNGVETHFLTVDAGVAIPTADTVKICFRAYSSASSKTVGIFGM